MRIVRGILHVHSDFSYDGRNSIPEWAAFLRAKGYNFVCLTEHDDDFDDAKMAGLVEECRKVSTPSFHMIPGLEFRCANKAHILGLALTKFYRTDDPIEAAQFIRANNGVSVIAHPRGYEGNITKELLKTVDGVEVWNGAKDSRFFPHPEVLGLYKGWREVNPNLIALGGADTHGIGSYFQLDTYAINNVKWNLKGTENIIPGKICGRYFRMCADTNNTKLQVSCLTGLRLIYDCLKFLKDKIFSPSGVSG